MKYIKATRSGGSGGNCVEWAHTDDGVYIRDSKHPFGPAILATPHEWDTLVAAARSGKTHPWVTLDDNGTVVSHDGTQLVFTVAEWIAFSDAAQRGECVPA